MDDAVVYHIKDADAGKFTQVLEEFFRFFKGHSETEAAELASAAYDNLLRGNDLDGNEIDNPNLCHFDEVLSKVTNGFYVPAQANRFRYKKGSRPKGRPKKPQNSTPPVSASEDEKKFQEKKIEALKKNLIAEYPALDRKDLTESIDNYCRLMVRINFLMETYTDTKAIKELTETQIKLGSFLGIDESAKAKQRQFEDKQSVASLSVKFQRTLDEFPILMDRFRYKELRLLLEKYDRQELSREMFENPSFGGMSVEAARDFVRSKESEFEAN